MRTLAGAPALAAVALLGACSGERASAPATPPAVVQPPSQPAANGPLVFARPVGGGGAEGLYELLATDAQGTSTTRFAEQLFSDRQVAVAPDGATLAFTRADSRRLGDPHDIFLVPVQGGEARRLERTPEDERAPRFSDDGRWLAFTYPTSIESDRVGIVDVESQARADVVPDSGDQYGGSWQPGSHRILYAHGSFLNGGYALHVTDAETGEVTVLPGTERYEGGAWTPRGRIVSFTRDESKRPDEFSVWLLGADGSDGRVVATTRGNPYYGLAFAPDDGAIALGVDFKDAGERIVVAELGDEPVELTADEGVPGWSPLWSPDGTTIAFLLGRSVWLMDADGTNPRRVPGSRGAEALLTWLAAPAG